MKLSVGHRSAAVALLAALMTTCLPAAVARADTLCLQVTMNDQPAGRETKLRLSAAGQSTRTLRPESGAGRFDGVLSGKWTLHLAHPKTKVIRTPLQISGDTKLLLDCGHADEWSGCQAKPLPGGC